MKKVIFLAVALLLLAPALAAQTPFEEIHGDILRKLEVERARAAIERRRTSSSTTCCTT